MATIKSYTDLEQSKKLIEILPPESADYTRLGKDESNVLTRTYFESCSSELKGWIGKDKMYPCWSLSALLGVIPQELFDGEYIINFTEGLDSKWIISYDGDNSDSLYGLVANADNLVDACVDIIEKLHKRKML